MAATQAKQPRNQALECFKFLAAISIVYLHVALPGRAGKLVDCLSRFAVPLFFAISGYFAYGARCGKLGRRFWHVVKLNLLASFSLVLWDCLWAASCGGSAADVLRSSIPSVNQLINWFFFHGSPFRGHLWYLAAIAACYAVLIVYVGFFGDEAINYRPLYTLGAALFCIRFAATDMLSRAGLTIPFYLFRDGWFTGIPMFSLGIFLRQYQARLIQNYRLTTARLIGLFLIGVALSLMQYYALGSSELPIGAVIQVIALLLLSTRYPVIDGGLRPVRAVISCLGFLSTVIYIYQFCAYDFYARFFAGPVAGLMGGLEIYVRPLMISLCAAAAGLAVLAVRHIIRRATAK